MALTPDQIKALLAKPEQPARRKKKNEIDTSVRDYVTWFKLAHKMVDEATGDLIKCSNPNCPDTRTTQLCVVIDEINMCRRCFMEGYGLVSVGSNNE